MRPAAGADGVRPSATPAELCSLTIVGRVCRWATAVAGSSPVAEDVGEGEAPVLAAAGVGEAPVPAAADERRLSSAWEPRASPSVP